MLITLPIIYLQNFNYCCEKGEFSCVLKYTDTVPVHNKKALVKQIIDWWVSSPVYLKFMKNYCIGNFIMILILLFYQNNVVFVKVTVPALSYGYAKEIHTMSDNG